MGEIDDRLRNKSFPQVKLFLHLSLESFLSATGREIPLDTVILNLRETD